MHPIMSLCADPNVVVGLASSALAGQGPFVIKLGENIGGDDHLPLGVVEPNRLLELPTDLRLVLDALVEVSANSSHTNMSLACGMRLVEPAGIELLLCGTHHVQDSTIRHLQETWRLMGNLSTTHSSTQEIQTQQDLAESHFDCFLLNFALLDLRQLFATKLKDLIDWDQRSASWQATLDDKERIRRNKIIEDCPSRFREIMDQVSRLTIQLNNLPPWNPAAQGSNHQDWGRCCDDLNQLNILVKELLKKKRPLSSWEASLDACDALRNHLKKITSLYRSISILRNYASPAHSGICCKALSIRTLEPVHPPSNALWPTSPDIWPMIRDKLFLDRYIAFLGDTGAHNLSLLPSRPEQLVVHPELTLILHLHRLSLEGEEWANYIGISGQACKPCSAWIRRFNSLQGRNGFAIGGSTNEWVPGWAMPESSEDNDLLKRDIVTTALTIYFSFMEDRKYWKRDRENGDLAIMLNQELFYVITPGHF